MAKKPKTFKERFELIQKDNKIKNKEVATNKLIVEFANKKKSDDDKIKFFRDQVPEEHLNKYIGEPIKTITIIDEKYSRPAEPVYFWLLGFMRDELKLTDIKKLVDTYSASESSAFHRNIGQGLAGTQDRVVASLRNIASLVQVLFKMVRELNMLTERLSLYYDGKKIGAERPGSPQNFAEMTIKDRFITFIEGGTKNPGSVLGLGSQVGFITLPDLFYHTHVFEKDKIQGAINKIKGINKKVREVLGRKLRAYVGWRESSQRHLETRRKFMLSFLKQHYNSIKMNIEWLKPYLKQVRRMMMNEGFKESPDILAAIEQAMMEIELLAALPSESKGKKPYLNLVIRFRSSPETEFSQRYQAPTTRFMGRAEVEFRARLMSANQVLAYRALKEQEEFNLLEFNTGVKEAMEALGDELKNYLAQAEKELPVEEAVKESIAVIRKRQKEARKEERALRTWYEGLDPFIQIGVGFREIFESFITIPAFKRKARGASKFQISKDEAEAANSAVDMTFLVYNIYKKAHKMLSW